MMSKVLISLMLLLILASLFTALYRLTHKHDGDRATVVRTLTVRIALSIGLFVALLLSFYLG